MVLPDLSSFYIVISPFLYWEFWFSKIQYIYLFGLPYQVVKIDSQSWYQDIAKSDFILWSSRLTLQLLLFLEHIALSLYSQRGFPGGSNGKESASIQEALVQSLGQEDPLEKEMATHPSILAWWIPWIQKSGELQSMGHKESGMTDQLTLSLSPYSQRTVFKSYLN